MYDRHHIVYTKAEQSVHKESLYIREHPSLIPVIDRRDHNDIHRECSSVPLLGHEALVQTLKFWTPDTDTLQSMDNLCLAIDKASKHPRSKPLESDLALLAILAIEQQRPFIASALRTQRWD